jgi:hypothetical protein
MKKIFSIVAICAVMTACSTTPPPAPVAVAPVRAVATNPQEASAQRVIDAVPEWFLNVPKKSDTIYAVGDGFSGSLSGALGNARANAFEGICQSAGGTVRSQTKIFRQDTEQSSTSISTTAIRNLCADIDVSGANVEKREVIRDGNRFHAYVLVAFPLGETNTIARTKQADKLASQALGAREREFKELDRVVEKGGAAPESEVKGITLMNVDDKEYVQKRDAALQKEGAVIGQTTVR